MRNKLWLPFVCCLLPLIFGCAQVPLDINYFVPAPGQPGIKTVVYNGGDYSDLQSANYTVDASPYEYNTIIALLLVVENKSGVDVQPADYTISLTDGRDLKPLKMLTRDDLIAIKAKYSGGGSGGSSGAIQDQLINNSMNMIMNTVNVPTKDKLINIINQGIDNYFAFRPVYAREKGAACFVLSRISGWNIP